jgi:hypothetical protein
MRLKISIRNCALLLLLAGGLTQAAVLPEDRVDLLYHHYEGGGVTVDGPSVLVRKKFGDSVSVTANYYVDMISSASVDVVTRASPYKERREQKSLSVDYLHGKTLYTLGYVDSLESDYRSDTAFFNVSQDMFGDLTTVTMGFSQGWDIVGERGDPTFAPRVDRRNFRLGVSQVITRNMLLGLNLETTTEEGYLQNPYRQMRYIGPDPGTYEYGPEVFPRTRTGTATSATVKYYLPWRAAAEGQYRFYNDTWGIRAHTAGVEYTQPAWGKWVFSGRYRFYTQTAATFYSDLFPSATYQNFMARDREFAAYDTNTIGVGGSYEFPLLFGASWFKKGTLNLHYDHIMINYKDFRDLRGYPPGTAIPGTEPLYAFSANVIQLYISFWY